MILILDQDMLLLIYFMIIFPDILSRYDFIYFLEFIYRNKKWTLKKESFCG